jgi:nucleosome binding factor SPN SPT16 subunit
MAEEGRNLRTTVKKSDADVQTRMNHQRVLHDKNNREAIKYFSQLAEEQGSKDKRENVPESYSKIAQIPSEAKSDLIYVDKRKQVVLLPVFGLLWPVHISFIKSVSKSEDGDFTFIRFNLAGPLSKNPKGEEEESDLEKDHFIRSITLKCGNQTHANEVFKTITELKKIAQTALQQQKELSDVIEQEPLSLVETRITRLNEVYARPSIDSKRHVGILEIHQNGVRFKPMLKTNNGQHIDLAFSNIKHFFFQPCDNEMIVLLHFHLKSPILIGKKKTFDVQIYREASESLVEDTSGKKRKVRYGDEDEIAQEREERKRREEMNKELESFAEAIRNASDGSLEIDVPYRELGFDGVPFRQSVFLQPTTDCLVHLSEPPFLIVTLSDIEVVFLERVVVSQNS